jgi:hypothetical protein
MIQQKKKKKNKNPKEFTQSLTHKAKQLISRLTLGLTKTTLPTMTPGSVGKCQREATIASSELAAGSRCNVVACTGG